MPSPRVKAAMEVYERLSGRQSYHRIEVYMEAILFNFPFQDTLRYMESVYKQGHRCYFFQSIYLPLIAQAAVRIAGRRPLLLVDDTSRKRYELLDAYVSLDKNSELPSMACLFAHSTFEEIQDVIRVAKVYGKRSPTWMRKLIYHNRAIDTLDWLSENPQKAEDFPERSRSLLPYAELKGIPKVQKIQYKWGLRLNVLRRQGMAFKDIITVYGRSQFRLYQK